jgi:hypothetical protein
MIGSSRPHVRIVLALAALAGSAGTVGLPGGVDAAAGTRRATNDTTIYPKAEPGVEGVTVRAFEATGADGAEVRVGGVAVIPQGLLPTSGHDSRLTDMSLVVVLVGCLAALMSRRPFPC